MQWHLKQKSSFSHSDHIFILQNAGSWFESCLVLPNYKILELLSFLIQKKCQFLNAFSWPFNPFRLSNGHGILHRLFLPQMEPDFFLNQLFLSVVEAMWNCILFTEPAICRQQLHMGAKSLFTGFYCLVRIDVICIYERAHIQSWVAYRGGKTQKLKSS